MAKRFNGAWYPVRGRVPYNVGMLFLDREYIPYDEVHGLVRSMIADNRPSNVKKTLDGWVASKFYELQGGFFSLTDNFRNYLFSEVTKSGLPNDFILPISRRSKTINKIPLNITPARYLPDFKPWSGAYAFWVHR